ncbi:hypothetical protein V6N11_056981 [Hibiscus sabdariffa]|uniref:RNase H type-1 domain-containing protein n=1 Tax=Hibiscus sabdariffa TaxID=183260 RepID=A0ABR2T683_9ROSI
MLTASLRCLWIEKRRLMKHTFAFIRFFSKEDIQKAINGGNGRRMDGFFILDKEARFQRKASLEKKRQTRGIVAQRKSGIQVPSLRDGRSYKEALEGDRKSNLPDGGKMTQKWVERSLDQHDDSRVDPKAKKADIPSTIKIAVEGKKYLIRIQTEDYQEEEAWIDGTKINSRKTESNTDGDGYGFEVSGDSWKILWDSEEEASFEVGTEQNNKGNERKSVEEANVLEKELSTHQSPLQAESSFGKMDQEVFGPEEHRKNLNMELQEVNLALERKQNTPDGPDSPSINNAYKNLPENRLLDIPISNMPLQSSIRLFWGIEVKLGSLPSDRLRWVKASTGCYMTKDMCKLLGKRDQDVIDWNTIWEVLAPFKVEYFAWKLLHGRLPTKLELEKRGTNVGSEPACGVIYGSYNVYFLWNPKPSLPVGLIYAQRESQHQSGKWFLTMLHYNLGGGAEQKEITVNRKEWGPPSVGSVKFNTDGAVKGYYGPAGIGGVLRDHNGRILMNFSKHIGMSDPVSAEILAIKEALVLFTKSAWAFDANLIIETDCSIVVGWLQNPTTTPLAFKDTVRIA